MSSSSLAGMSIQFRALTFYSRSKDQLQEQCLKKSVTLLSVVIRALSSLLGPNPENDIATDLYSGSTLIANMDESDYQFIVNRFKESATSLSAVIGVLNSPLGLHLKSDLDTYIYSGSTPIAIIDESDLHISFNRLKKFATSLSAVIKVLCSPLGPHPESDLETDLYSDSTPIAIKTSLIVGSVSDNFKNATASLQEVTKA
jgi:hypothetical protein